MRSMKRMVYFLYFLGLVRPRASMKVARCGFLKRATKELPPDRHPPGDQGRFLPVLASGVGSEVPVLEVLFGIVFGFWLWFALRYGAGGFYTVGPNERALLTTFGQAARLGEQTTLSDPISASLKPDERDRYVYPIVRVIGPGFYWKLPWQKVYRVSIATGTVSIAFDPELREANMGGTLLEAVPKDQLNIGLTGQLRFGISERNLYAYVFGVKNPVAHVMGYFISILRDRIANFAAPQDPSETA